MPKWTIEAGSRRIVIMRHDDPRRAHTDRPALDDSQIGRLLRRLLSHPSGQKLIFDIAKSVGGGVASPGGSKASELLPHLERAFQRGVLVAEVVDVERVVVGGGSRPVEEDREADKGTSAPPKKKSIELVIRKPGNGEVFLVGDKIEVEAVVIEDGVESGHPVRLTASGGPIERNSYVLRDGGRHTITAECPEVSARAQVQFSAVTPSVFRVVSLGKDVFAVYDHQSAERKSGLIEAGDDPVRIPTVAKMGTEVMLEVALQAFKALTRPAEVEVCLGGAEPPILWRSAEGKAVVKELAQDVVSLRPDRALPDRICRLEWKPTWTYRVKWFDGIWSHDAEDPAKWISMPGPPEFFLYTVWGPPQFGEASPLREIDYDHFHVRMAALWAEGAHHLKLCGEGSIPYQVNNRAGHYRWPADYRFFRGEEKPVKENVLPSNYSKLQGHPATLRYPKSGDADWPRAKKNAGWKVLDNKQAAGGRCNQQASLFAAILNTLGIRARLLYLTSRWGRSGNGLITGQNHDPITLAAPCHKPGTDTMWNFHGVCLLDTEGAEREATVYDGSFSIPYQGTWPPAPCIDDHQDDAKQVGRTHCYRGMLRNTSHDLRPPAEREGGQCRCGHDMPETAKACPTCGAQPTFRYRCTACDKGRLDRGESRCPNCGKRRVGLFAAALIAPCPKCGKTVHDSMRTCWNCDTSLETVVG